MSIFRRGSKAPDTGDEPQDARDQAVEAADAASDVETAGPAIALEASGADPNGAAEPSDEAAEPSDEAAEDSAEDSGTEQDDAAARGPFDASEVDLGDDDRLDLGALRIRGVAGMELRLEVDEEAQQVVGATAVLGESAVQLQAFAAPKTAGIWDGIRAEIAESIVAQGGTADETRGPLGTELRTRMPSAGPDGRTVFAPARFAGVDGPRWFLRAVFSGRAAIDDEAARPLLDVVRNAVVVRGDAAMAPREMLTLNLPQEVQPTQADQGGDTRTAEDLKPFERGPEITEVR